MFAKLSPRLSLPACLPGYHPSQHIVQVFLFFYTEQPFQHVKIINLYVYSLRAVRLQAEPKVI